MQLFDALGPRVASELRDKRETLPRQLLLGHDAAAQLAAALCEQAPGRRALVLFDTRTRTAAGEPCLHALRAQGFGVHELLVPDAGRHTPRCDDLTLRELQAALPQGDVLVGVGSGVISDLAKWIAFERGMPAAIFATAASMNGYAAANVAPAVRGVKTLIHARAHRLIAADPRVLAAAPHTLTSAGLGDIIAKSVSGADWRMNALLFDEPYSAAIAGISDQVEQRLLNDPAALAKRSEGAVSALFEALVFSGCAMTLQGSSLPASGGEHLISHALDMRADAEGGAHDLHGRQVGLGTIFAAAVYERVLALQAPRFFAGPLPFDRAGWGPIADAVAEHHQKQGARLRAAVERLQQGERWGQLRAALSPGLKSAAWVKGVLVQAGAAHRIGDLGLSRERFLWAVHNGAQIRERFTSLDLGWATGVLPAQAEAIVDQHLMQ